MRTLPAAAATCAVALLSLAGTPAHSQPVPGAYTLPDSVTPFIPGSATLKEGGLSSLFYAGRNEFWSITDRGPNVDSGSAKIFPVPNFQPTIYKIHLNADGTFSLVASYPLKRPDGTAATGLPNPAPYNSGEIALDTNFNPVGIDDWGFDTEGILRASDGTFWFCEEYAPGIAHVAADGTILARVRPQPTSGGLPDILRKRVANRGFEGIAMTPNGKIYAIVQSGMANSFANTDAANSSAGNNTEMFRLVEFDPATGLSRMFVYLMDAGYPVTGSNARRRDIKIGDMAAVNNDEILLTEHVSRGANNVKKIYRISLAGATPISNETFQTPPGVFKTLEELTRAGLTTVAGLTPVAKTLAIDLNNPGAGNTPWPAALDKPEGLAIVTPTRIAVGNDFGVAADAAGHVILTGAPSKVFIYDLAAPLNFQQPAQVTLSPAGNAPICPSGGVTFRAAAIGTPAPTVQWQVSTNGGQSYTNVNGATADSLTISGLTLAMNGNRYRAVYSNALGNSTSEPATLSVADNQAPVATVATLPTVTGECSVTVATRPTALDNCAGTITGITSDPLTYTAQGTYTIHWTYSDGNGNSSPQNQTVIVRDTTRPTIRVSVTPTTLWPANHKMKTITATVTASDNCSGVTWALTSITANENVDADVQNAAIGGADNSFDLRADRAGNGNGRTYTITYTTTDIAGNTATASATVTVPHDQGNNKMVIATSDAASGEGFASSAAPVPFNGSTTISFTLPQAAPATVRVYDVKGALVATLTDGMLDAGAHTARWNGSDAQGRMVGAGTYFYAITSQGLTETGSLVVVR
jgi:hypothetical protein